jgi:hypothetical protein
MVSTEFKFISVTPQKTGSTSMTDALMSFCGITKDDIELQFRDCFEITDEFGDNGKHRIIKRIMSQWDSVYPDMEIKDFYKFGSIRNPWERVISWYSMCGHTKDEEVNYEKLKDFINNHIYTGLMGMYDSFSYKGKLYVDDFIEFNTLQQDFKRICDNIGINPELKHLVCSDRKHPYQYYYNKETADLVERRWKKDITFFGYKFK